MTEVNTQDLNHFPNIAFVTALCERQLPIMLVLDVVNYCNLDCIHCPQKNLQKAPGFAPRQMGLQRIKKMAQEVAQSTAPILIRVAGDGEPLLHPACLDILKAFSSLPHTITDITTNGLLLTRQRSAALLEMGVDIVSISLDALTEPTYGQVRRGGTFARVMQNIFILLELREIMRSPTKLLVSFIEQKENCHEVDMFHRFWEPLADFVILRRLHTAGSKVKQEEAASRTKARGENRFPCPHPFKRLAVNFNGSISYCAHDWDDSAIVGNIDNLGLAQAWHSAALANLRHFLLDGNLPVDSACSFCRDWASTRWDFGYELLVDKVLHDPKRTLLPSVPILTSSHQSIKEKL